MSRINYAKENNDFRSVLQKRVYDYMKSHDLCRWGGKKLFLKILFFFLVYILTYVGILFTENLIELFLLYAILGITSVFLVLNGAHDAAHNAVFHKKISINSFY